ncbi:MAG: tryptophanase [Candidatus Wallbacteria bacterium]|nr:tryptophanase [Candidatus Wallbacteria bacterium]
MPKTIIEPFKIKVIEPIRMTNRQEREAHLEEAGNNLFALHSADVLIDLLTDSGTSAMSAAQWAGLTDGDESYAGSRSFYRFENAVRDLTALKHIIPTHQGRAAEKILFSIVGGKGRVIPNNTHFDTTRANIEFSGAEAIDLPCKEGDDLVSDYPFKGNMDVDALRQTLERYGRERVPLVMMTVTNNSHGGQAVSLANMRAVRELCDEFRVPLFIDACRFAENSYLVKLREPGQRERPVIDIARDFFRLANGCTFSAKKDAFANIGGFIAVDDDELAQQARNLLILTEGFPTYGGLAGRDLEAIAIGLEEILHEDYLAYRIRTIEYLAERLIAAEVPLLRPHGGHAVYLDARRFLPHIPAEQLPGQALACELYLEAGIRSCEIGTVMFGHTDPETGREVLSKMDLVRLAFPRRVYTQSHSDYVLEAIVDVYRRRDAVRGFRFSYQAPMLRHFTARFERL